MLKYNPLHLKLTQEADEKLMRTILWFIFFWLYLIKLLPDQAKADALFKAGRTEELDALVDRIVRKWSRAMLWAGGVRVTVSGADNIPSGPAVIVSNHQGNFDIPILLASLDKPKGFVAKVEIQKMPMIRTWMKYLNCIFIDRSDARQSITALSGASGLLASGHSLIIFPEGTRSKSSQVGEFKAGALKMALKAGVPVVPVVIDGSWKIMERQGKWIRPGNVDLRILPPVETKNLSKEEARNLSDDIRQLITRDLAAHAGKDSMS
jgi:1-acyl-sn-glycerol-3-phosphate acyltransferase